MQLAMIRNVLQDDSCTSCFFCGDSLSEGPTALLRDLETNRKLGWMCATCMHRSPDQLQIFLLRRIRNAQRQADSLFHCVELLNLQASEQENVLAALAHATRTR